MTSRKPIKPPMSPGEVMFGLFPSLVFLTMSLADFSFDTLVYETSPRNFELVRQYLVWRAEAPYFSWVLFFLGTGLLPLNLYGAVTSGLLGLFQKRASALRQAIDFIDFLLTLLFVYIVYLVNAPFQAHLRSGEIPLNEENFAVLYSHHVLLLGMNLFALSLLFARYFEGKSALALKDVGPKKEL